MRSKIGDFPGFYLRASGWAFMGPGESVKRRSESKCSKDRQNAIQQTLPPLAFARLADFFVGPCRGGKLPSKPVQKVMIICPYSAPSRKIGTGVVQ
ncbi:BQ5605_C012g06758 [Microbotryum silenes-dioicae]|uniref:BQ5605_C012g06758 protein n=1 Tax=Microbotryum silenes-dioicae TaxID=796604 RepID=A0A2X0LS86_9BASI|nr:BQ5605_C012g06758 [Microbotryum silenes-dioicae]